MHHHGIPAHGQRIVASSKRALIIVAAALLVGGTAPSTIAAPGAPSMVAAAAAANAQNVDWLSSDQAASLSAGIDVLVPSWVPAPFDGVAPSISVASGYYELYWMIPGGAPTFLQVQGVAGGGLPAGSPADLNKQLSVNDSVQGWPAIHDIGIPAGSDTPIYDQVWWIANGVLYSVSSLNMTGSDTMSLANSLVSLQVPAPAEPAPQPQQPTTVPGTDASDGTGPVSEDLPPAVDPAQVAAPDTSAANTATSPQDTSAGTTSSDAGSGTSSQASGDQSNGSDTSETSATATGPLPSDGTGGPRPPVIGSDGTGGVQDTSVRYTP